MLRRLWKWVCEHLIPIHVIPDYERIGNRWGLLFRRGKDRILSVDLLLYVTMPYTRTEWSPYDNRYVTGRPRYFLLVGLDLPTPRVRATLFARGGRQLECI